MAKQFNAKSLWDAVCREVQGEDSSVDVEDYLNDMENAELLQFLSNVFENWADGDD